MRKNHIELSASRSKGLYWSLGALAQLAGWDPIETRSCPITIKYSNNIVGKKTIGLEAIGKYKDMVFDLKISILQAPNSTWYFNSVLMWFGKPDTEGTGALVSPADNPELFPGYQAHT